MRVAGDGAHFRLAGDDVAKAQLIAPDDRPSSIAGRRRRVRRSPRAGPVVLHDDVRLVGVVDRAAEDIRVAGDRVVEAARAEREGADELAGVLGLARAGGEAGGVEVDQPVHQHLGMDAEVADAAFRQEGADGARHAADADLQAGPVLDFGGDEARDGAVDLGGRGGGQLGDGLMVAFDDVVHLAQMNAVLDAENVGDALAHLDDHQPGALDHGGAGGQAGSGADRRRAQLRRVPPVAFSTPATTRPRPPRSRRR